MIINNSILRFTSILSLPFPKHLITNKCCFYFVLLSYLTLWIPPLNISIKQDNFTHMLLPVNPRLNKKDNFKHMLLPHDPANPPLSGSDSSYVSNYIVARFANTFSCPPIFHAVDDNCCIFSEHFMSWIPKRLTQQSAYQHTQTATQKTENPA